MELHMLSRNTGSDKFLIVCSINFQSPLFFSGMLFMDL